MSSNKNKCFSSDESTIVESFSIIFAKISLEEIVHERCDAFYASVRKMTHLFAFWRKKSQLLQCWNIIFCLTKTSDANTLTAFQDTEELNATLNFFEILFVMFKTHWRIWKGFFKWTISLSQVHDYELYFSDIQTSQKNANVSWQRCQKISFVGKKAIPLNLKKLILYSVYKQRLECFMPRNIQPIFLMNQLCKISFKSACTTDFKVVAPFGNFIMRWLLLGRVFYTPHNKYGHSSNFSFFKF